MKNEKKETYKEAQIEIISFELRDVITTSPDPLGREPTETDMY